MNKIRMTNFFLWLLKKIKKIIQEEQQIIKEWCKEG